MQNDYSFSPNELLYENIVMYGRHHLLRIFIHNCGSISISNTAANLFSIFDENIIIHNYVRIHSIILWLVAMTNRQLSSNLNYFLFKPYKNQLTQKNKSRSIENKEKGKKIQNPNPNLGIKK